jgi:hypothetical protein
MSNTVIQIKRSTITSTPTAGSLSAAEPAYSYLSDKLYLGSSNGSSVIEIGGKSTVDKANTAYNQANAAYDKANSANVVASSAYDKANSANVLAYNTGIGANAYASAAAAGANAFTASTIAGANAAVGTGANTYLLSVIAGANTAVGAGTNAFAAATIAGANTAVGAGANAYSNQTFVKLVAGNQTITGNLSVSGSLTVSGNTYKIDANTLYVQDPLIYLAGNNYTSDLVDIGFVGNYVNATGSNVHTGLFRDATYKEYFLFQGYDKEPEFNDIDPNGNNFTLAVLNSALRTSNLNLGGVNAITWITSSYDKANSANLLAYNTGIGANAFAAATIAGANAAVGAGANSYATSVGTSGNAYALSIATAVGTSGNTYATAVGAAGNAYSTSIVGTVYDVANTKLNKAFSVRTITTSNTLTSSDNVILTDGTLTVTLPNATIYIGQSFEIKNINTGTITIVGTGSDLIDTYSNVVILFKNSMLGVRSTGSSWIVY